MYIVLLAPFFFSFEIESMHKGEVIQREISLGVVVRVAEAPCCLGTESSSRQKYH